MGSAYTGYILETLLSKEYEFHNSSGFEHRNDG